MSRIPPSLLYLTIYNPTLRPTAFISTDDEDAEEQAHILFYTSKERAVSRDRMLRQVGLAKALVNFSELFRTTEPCNSIHSQSKRMVMVSPEPDFWIHAAVEPAKTRRPAVDNAKGKGKEKEKAKAKDREKAKGSVKEELPIYDYHDGSVHDSALCTHLERGYEMFKLTHGSLTSILSTLGQEALELQLERFFTVWAWKWNFENDPDLGDDLGLPLHPLYRSLVPLLDNFASKLAEEIVPIVISPPHLIPSTRFSNAGYPSSLSRHLLLLTPPSRPLTIRQETDQTINTSPNISEPIGTIQPSPVSTPLNPSNTAGSSSSSSGPTFLGMPAVNVNMDVRKWSWPGVLSFGRNQGKKMRGQVLDDDGPEPKEKGIPREEGDNEETQPVPVNVDTSSLEDAMLSDARSVAAISVSTDPSSVTGVDFPLASDSQTAGGPETITEDHLSSTDAAYQIERGLPSTDAMPPNNEKSSLDSVPPSIKGETLPSQTSLSTPAPEFMSTMVHLPVGHDALVTKWRKVLYLGNHDMIVALVEGPANDNSIHDLSSVANKSTRLLEDIRTSVEVQSKALAASLPSATKILQPRDRHIISRVDFTDSSPGFAPKSEQFYNGKQLLDKDSNISEVFSRGQNPQHWHVTRRGLGVDDNGHGIGGEVFLEVSRKEASLTDVDNVLVSVVKRFN